MGNYHVRFCSGSGAGDRPTDPQRSRPRYRACKSTVTRACGCSYGEGTFPHPRGGSRAPLECIDEPRIHVLLQKAW